MISTPSQTFDVQPTLPQGVWDLDAPYFLPLGIVRGDAAAALLQSGAGLPLAGVAAYGAVGVIWRDGGTAKLAALDVNRFSACSPGGCRDAVNNMGVRRKPWAGLSLDRPSIMGIVNVTPDSFSDGGETAGADAAIARAMAMVQAGANIIDVGGESTRPGAAPVDQAQEIARVVPVVSALASQGIVVSIDTRHAAVMRAATAAGAAIINDVSALTGPGAMAAAVQSGAAVCLMHMQGQPGTMQHSPHYACAPLDVYDYLKARVDAAVAAGLTLDRITVDPGIGFGKDVAHNCQILANLALLHGLGAGILLGVSRKRFVAALSQGEAPKDRFPGSLTAALSGLRAGVQILRVHDVAETAQAVKLWQAVAG